MTSCSPNPADVSSCFLVSGASSWFLWRPPPPLGSPLILEECISSLIGQLQFFLQLLVYEVYLQLLAARILCLRCTLEVRVQDDPRPTLCPMCSLSENTRIFLPATNKDSGLIPAQILLFSCLCPLSFLRCEPSISPLCAPPVKDTL